MIGVTELEWAYVLIGALGGALFIHVMWGEHK